MPAIVKTTSEEIGTSGAPEYTRRAKPNAAGPGVAAAQASATRYFRDHETLMPCAGQGFRIVGDGSQNHGAGLQDHGDGRQDQETAARIMETAAPVSVRPRIPRWALSAGGTWP